ncbi:hypothetical protein ACRAWF_01915 [Streptomyces sp. L7]
MKASASEPFRYDVPARLAAGSRLVAARDVGASGTNRLPADQPLFSSVSVQLIAAGLSVEYPTANSTKHVSSYSAEVKYPGYSILKCYTYQYDANVDANNYFVPKRQPQRAAISVPAARNPRSGAFLSHADR